MSPMGWKEVEEWRRSRPDFSDYVVHFTSNRPPFGADEPKNAKYDHLAAISKQNAYERLVAILEGKRIEATPMPWTNSLAVAFTECPWGSLLQHAEVYSPYGVGFKKEALYKAGGGPAIYMRPELRAAQSKHIRRYDPFALPFPQEFYAFVTPFVPSYAPDKKGMKIVDYTHEREWRVPGDFQFTYDEVECVVVNTYDDEARFPRPLKDAIGRERFLIMDNYRQIHTMWPG
jgi:hypothetical protein